MVALPRITRDKLHRLVSSFILGYHGCDKSVADRLIKGAAFTPSENGYDWLGPGIYFWEANPLRGLDFARELKSRGKVKNPAVVGAVIELGLCLDMVSQAGIEHFVYAHRELETLFSQGEVEMPKNSRDLLQRHLDCAVIRMFHDMREKRGRTPVDTVRGVFIEGEPVVPGSGVYRKTHIQVAVCNPVCIKGVFQVQPQFLK